MCDFYCAGSQPTPAARPGKVLLNACIPVVSTRDDIRGWTHTREICMKFVEQLEGRRMFSITSEVLAASGVAPSDVGDIHNPDAPYWVQRDNRGLDIFNPTESARLFEATAIDGNGAPHG